MDLIIDKPRRRALLLFSAGFLIAFLLAGVGIWANLEATVYGFINVGDTNLNTLHCPAILSVSDTGYVTASFINTHIRPINLILDVEISGPLAFRKIREEVPLQPGESHVARWAITRADIDLGNFIFAYVYRFANYPQRSAGATCGTFVVNLPGIPGWLFIGFFLLASVGLIFAGLLGWERAHHPIHGKPRELLYAMTFLAVIIYIAMLFSLQGMWLFGIIALVVVILSISGILFFALYR